MSKINKSLLSIILFLLYTFLIPTLNINIYLKVIIDVVLLLMVILFYRDDLKSGFSIGKNNIFKLIKDVLIFWVLLLVANLICNGLIAGIFDIYLPNNEAQKMLLSQRPIYLIFSMLIFSPLVEELVFRKGFKDILKNDKLYIILSSIIYAVLYVVFSLEGMNYLFIISYFVSAFIYAMSYLKTKNISVPILIHFIENLFVLIIYICGV